MEDRDIRQRDLIPVIGSSSVISDVVNGKRSMSKAHARKLAEYLPRPSEDSASTAVSNQTCNAGARLVNRNRHSVAGQIPRDDEDRNLS